jgi:hypothetical protein
MRDGMIGPCILAATVIVLAIWATVGPPKTHSMAVAHYRFTVPP